MSPACLPSYLLVTSPRILLHPSGDLSLEGGSQPAPSHLLPPTCPPLGSMTPEDWRRLGLYSVAVTLTSAVAGDNLSRELVMLLRCILVDNLAQVPNLRDIITYLGRKVGPTSAARLVSGLCTRMQGVLKENNKLSSRFTSSGSVLRPRRSSGWKKGSVSCPSLVANPSLGDSSSSQSNIESRVNSYLQSRKNQSESRINPSAESRINPSAESRISSSAESNIHSSTESRYISSESGLNPSLESRLNPSLECRLSPELDPRHRPVLQQFSSLPAPNLDQCIENLINNNDVFNIMNLPGLKLKARRPPPPPPTTPPVYVPGFIRRRQRAAVAVSLGAGLAGPVVRVVLLTGHKVEVTLDKGTKVSEVLRVCLERMRVRDESASLFGLFSCVDEELLYLKGDSCVAAHLHNGVLTLYLRYVQSPEYHDLCPPLQHLLYLQLRQDVMAGSVAGLEESTTVQLGLLAAQVETSSGDIIKLEPKYFLPRNAGPSACIAFDQRSGDRLTGSQGDAQALFCGLVVNSPEYSLYRYWGRENRGEGSRRISLRILEDRIILGGQSYTFAQMKQLSHSQSYLQILVKAGDELKRNKIFFPDNKPRHIHDLLAELQLRHTTPAAPEMEDRGVATKTRRSLGKVCSQIAGAAREVGRTIRTPSKRTRSLSTDAKAAAGAKRRKLSLGRAESTKRQEDPENKENRPTKEDKVDKDVVSRGARPRMGTRMSAGLGRTGSPTLGSSRILQLAVGREELAGWHYTVSGHGLQVSGHTGHPAVLRTRDRVIALNGVSLEQVSVNTFWKILPTFGENIDIIVSRTVQN